MNKQITKTTLNNETLYTSKNLYELTLAQMVGAWIKATSIGSENLYFTFTDDAGKTQNGYCKCL